MPRDRLTSLLVAGAVLLITTAGAVHGGRNKTAELARFIAGLARATINECPPEVRQRHEERLLICAAYGARWSSFKSDWEFILDRIDLPVLPEPQSAWTRRDGRYEREYLVEKSGLTVVFDEKQRLIVFAYTLEGTEDDAASAAPRGVDSTGNGDAVRMAGFGGVTTPRLREDGRVEPAYPEAAAERGIEGSVALEAVILADGTVSELKLLYERPEGLGFGEAALDAVRQWIYEPALYEGRPVDAKFTVYVPFEPTP